MRCIMEGSLSNPLLGSSRAALGGTTPFTLFLVHMERVLRVQLTPYIGESWKVGGTRETLVISHLNTLNYRTRLPICQH